MWTGGFLKNQILRGNDGRTLGFWADSSFVLVFPSLVASFSCWWTDNPSAVTERFLQPTLFLPQWLLALLDHNMSNGKNLHWDLGSSWNWTQVSLCPWFLLVLLRVCQHVGLSERWEKPLYLRWEGLLKREGRVGGDRSTSSFPDPELRLQSLQEVRLQSEWFCWANEV